MNDKDQAAAIDHVASVSKNPHAAMIVKQLITGWSVEFEYAVGEWKISDYPTWSPGSKYRLIEPKPSKPAYRVYKLTHGGTSTIDRGVDVIPDDVEWLGDWIEYDTPKEWPTPLVERIAAIDIKAAEWIVDNWDDLVDGKYAPNKNYNAMSDELQNMLVWELTEHGDMFWRKISRQLGE